MDTAPSTMNDANTIRMVTGCSIENFARRNPTRLYRAVCGYSIYLSSVARLLRWSRRLR